VKDQLTSFLKGSAESFIIVNILVSLVTYIVYPDFFHIGLLFRPQILVLTIPLSALFYINIKYLKQWMDSSEEIREEFEEVKPDLSH
jgi:hypothetical protein